MFWDFVWDYLSEGRIDDLARALCVVSGFDERDALVCSDKLDVLSDLVLEHYDLVSLQGESDALFYVKQLSQDYAGFGIDCIGVEPDVAMDGMYNGIDEAYNHLSSIDAWSEDFRLAFSLFTFLWHNRFESPCHAVFLPEVVDECFAEDVLPSFLGRLNLFHALADRLGLDTGFLEVDSGHFYSYVKSGEDHLFVDASYPWGFNVMGGAACYERCGRCSPGMFPACKDDPAGLNFLLALNVNFRAELCEDLSSASELYDAQIMLRDSVGARLGKASVLFDQGRYDDALEQLRIAELHDFNNAGVDALHSLCLFHKGILDESEDYADSAWSVDDQDPLANFAKALCLAHDGEYLTAASFLSVSTRNGASPDFYLLRARCLERAGLYLAAERDYEEVIGFNPPYLANVLVYKACLLVHLDRHDEAHDLVDSAVRLSGTFLPETHLVLSKVYADRGEYEAASYERDLFAQKKSGIQTAAIPYLALSGLDSPTID